MSSQVSQLEVNYNPVEDRLLLRIHTSDLKEFRLWMTRRLTKALSQVLHQLLDQMSAKEQQVEQAKQVGQEFAHQQQQRQAPVPAGLQQQVATQPLGDVPLLIGQIQVKPHPSGQPNFPPLLSLNTMEGQGIELPATPHLLQILVKLIAEGSARADWDLNQIISK